MQVNSLPTFFKVSLAIQFWISATGSLLTSIPKYSLKKFQIFYEIIILKVQKSIGQLWLLDDLVRVQHREDDLATDIGYFLLALYSRQ